MKINDKRVSAFSSEGSKLGHFWDNKYKDSLGGFIFDHPVILTYISHGYSSYWAVQRE